MSTTVQESAPASSNASENSSCDGGVRCDPKQGHCPLHHLCIASSTTFNDQSPSSSSSTTMSSSDDEPFCHGARNGLLSSADDKQSKALKHFDHWCCKRHGIDTVQVADISCRGVPPQESDEAVNEFWDIFSGSFVTCMGTDARAGCKATRARIGRNTAEGCFSSVKVHLENRFRTKRPLLVFQDEHWKKLREKLKALFPKRSTQGATEHQALDKTVSHWQPRVFGWGHQSLLSFGISQMQPALVEAVKPLQANQRT